jgi:hypothetical protein
MLGLYHDIVAGLDHFALWQTDGILLNDLFYDGL